MMKQDKEFAQMMGYPEDTWFELKPQAQREKEYAAYKLRRDQLDLELNWMAEDLVTIDEILSADHQTLQVIAQTRQQELDQDDVFGDKYIYEYD